MIKTPPTMEITSIKELPVADICTASSMAEIAALPAAAIVTTSALIRALRLADDRGIRQRIQSGELPAPFPWAGRNVWLAGHLARHFEKLADQAERDAAEKERTIKRHTA